MDEGLLERPWWWDGKSPVFIKPFNDWEVEELEWLLCEVGRYVLADGAEDEVRLDVV